LVAHTITFSPPRKAAASCELILIWSRRLKAPWR
jgi:hypothetical protein